MLPNLTIDGKVFYALTRPTLDITLNFFFCSVVHMLTCCFAWLCVSLCVCRSPSGHWYCVAVTTRNALYMDSWNSRHELHSEHSLLHNKQTLCPHQ